MVNPKTITRLSSHTYELPVFQVTQNGLEAIEPVVIQFCKGSKDAPVHPGFITESLIQLCVEHLESVNDVVPSDHTTAMIAHLRIALEIADERIKDREARGVLQTYQK
jgi:hypothetical protein